MTCRVQGAGPGVVWHRATDRRCRNRHTHAYMPHTHVHTHTYTTNEYALIYTYAHTYMHTYHTVAHTYTHNHSPIYTCHAHVCVHACAHVNAPAHMCMHTHACIPHTIHTHSYIHTHKHTHLCTCMHTYMYCTHAPIYLHMYIHTHTCIHIPLQIRLERYVREISKIFLFLRILFVYSHHKILCIHCGKQNIENQDHIDPTVWDSDDIAAKPGLLCAGSFLIGGVTKTGPTLPHYNGQQRGHAQL